jgi:hypothetical protein
VVEHSLGKGEVESSILSGSTSFSLNATTSHFNSKRKRDTGGAALRDCAREIAETMIKAPEFKRPMARRYLI